MCTTNRFAIIHKALKEKRNTISVNQLCKTAHVSRSGYYRWRNAERKRAEKQKSDETDFRIILDAYNYKGYDKGVKGIHMRLLHKGIRINHKKIRRLMHKFDLRCGIRKKSIFRRSTNISLAQNVVDNLLDREFKVHGVRKTLLTDFTYIPFRGGYVYLSTIIDSYTSECLAYVLSKKNSSELVVNTVKKLVKNDNSLIGKEIIIHSDQGCQYTSQEYKNILEKYGFRQSMSRRGNCWDNAPQESFYGHMKDELMGYIRNCESFAKLKKVISKWFHYYNYQRYQWKLGKMSPHEYYNSIIDCNKNLKDVA